MLGTETSNLRLCSRILAVGFVHAVALSQPAVIRTPFELHVGGDFDGDGMPDVAIMQHAGDRLNGFNGNYRVGYQLERGRFVWDRPRRADLDARWPVDAIVGRFVSERDSLALASLDGRLQILDFPAGRGEPKRVDLQAHALGIQTIASLPGRAPGGLDALLARTAIFSPDRQQLEILFPIALEADTAPSVRVPTPHRLLADPGRGSLELIGALALGDRVAAFWTQAEREPGALGPIRMDFVAAVVSETNVEVLFRESDAFRGSQFVLKEYADDGTTELLVYAPGEPNIQRFRFQLSGSDFRLLDRTGYRLKAPLRHLTRLPGVGGLVAMMADRAGAAVIQLNDSGEVDENHTIQAPQDLEFAGLVSASAHAVVLLQQASGSYSRRYSKAYQVWEVSGGSIRAGTTQELPWPDADGWKIANSLNTHPPSRMDAYDEIIPLTKVSFRMLPIPGGDFVMGTPEDEIARQDSESPQVRVKIDPFWMSECEVTWDLFDLFSDLSWEDLLNPYRRWRSPAEEQKEETLADGVAAPSTPYRDMSFGMGRRNGYPAIRMRPFLASRFCKWLSALTGHFYRLPTEGEWEYACRAGTTTAFSFGNDAGAINDYAWFENNSDSEFHSQFVYHKVRAKLPNAWGLYDMHGNVAELCLDQLTPDYRHISDGSLNPWTRPTRAYSTVVRGGSFDDSVDRLRSGARSGTEASWMISEPSIPKSTDWFSDCKTVGIRLVRPLKVPNTPEEISRFWNLGNEFEPPDPSRDGPTSLSSR